MSTIDAIDSQGPSEGMTGVIILPKWDEGDLRTEWNSKNESETEAARKQFVDMKANGYKAYRIDPKNGEKGELLKEFDPKAEKIVLVMPFAGG